MRKMKGKRKKGKRRKAERTSIKRYLLFEQYYLHYRHTNFHGIFIETISIQFSFEFHTNSHNVHVLPCSFCPDESSNRNGKVIFPHARARARDSRSQLHLYFVTRLKSRSRLAKQLYSLLCTLK